MGAEKNLNDKSEELEAFTAAVIRFREARKQFLSEKKTDPDTSPMVGEAGSSEDDTI